MTRFELLNRTTEQAITASATLWDTPMARGRGLMFRRDIPDDAAYIFEYPDISRRGVHMLFLFEPLDVLWLIRGEVEHKTTLRPFVGHAAATARTVIEFPEGGADGIRVGDKLAWGPR